MTTELMTNVRTVKNPFVHVQQEILLAILPLKKSLFECFESHLNLQPHMKGSFLSPIQHPGREPSAAGPHNGFTLAAYTFTEHTSSISELLTGLLSASHSSKEVRRRWMGGFEQPSTT